MSPPMLATLLAEISNRHPGLPVRVFVNESDRGCAELVAAGLPAGVEFFRFPQLEDLVGGFVGLTHLYCTDTGLYHLAAAMGVPATVFYGPTQPWKNMMPGQSTSRGVRLAVLGREHCEEKSCVDPVCIEGAIRGFGRSARPGSLERTPAQCPLRQFPVEKLNEISWHENTDRQA